MKVISWDHSQVTVIACIKPLPEFQFLCEFPLLHTNNLLHAFSTVLPHKFYPWGKILGNILLGVKCWAGLSLCGGHCRGWLPVSTLVNFSHEIGVFPHPFKWKEGRLLKNEFIHDKHPATSSHLLSVLGSHLLFCNRACKSCPRQVDGCKVVWWCRWEWWWQDWGVTSRGNPKTRSGPCKLMAVRA